MLAVITRALFPAAIKGEISLVCELFCGDHCSIALKAVKRLVDRCKRRAIRGVIPFEWAGGGRLETAAYALKSRSAV